MLELKTKKELGTEAFKLAQSFGLVRYRSTTYIPAHYETRDTSVTPPPEETIWLPMKRDDIQQMAADQFDTLFANDSELTNFAFMVAQNSMLHQEEPRTLLVRTTEGLKELRGDGQLHDPTGLFVPNTMGPVLNAEQEAKQRVLDVISEWLNDEDEAHSLLKHMATALAPGWSAVKYVLLLGEGRNGKGLLLKMIHTLFGDENVSSVSRQDMAERSPVILDLNGKLLNIVYDGMAEYVKDSGPEKTLVAGEPFSVRRLYESTPTPVKTNALFLESLNHEPKSRDKSSALQKRLVRFHFPNTYALDHKFERQMLREESLGAFLALLIDHYVHEDRVAEALAPSRRVLELQLEHMFVNSLGLQFLKYIEETDALGMDAIIDTEVSDLVSKFQSWRIKENDLGQWAEPDVITLFQPILSMDRKSKRVDGKPRKVRVVTGLKTEAAAFIETLKGEEDDVEALVADRHLRERHASAVHR